MLDLIGAVDQLIDVDGLGPYRWPPPSPDVVPATSIDERFTCRSW
ncbi:hypothetical protein [Micromonospora trifolii]|nr:hypothetical protein [Micromonospora trifolii]